MKALKIEPTGRTEIVDLGGTMEEQNECIWEILDGYFDIVRLKYGAVLLVNDEGLLRGLPVNLEAMRISSYPMLAGTALIVGTEDTGDGEIFADCPEYYLEYA